uniref:Antimicrobial peptide type 2 n=1 Tax=Pandalus japonicus TaxID=666362 RepID=I7AFQ9_PANJP|nr:antimicrobial peptide type 2 precursor [Pandalus japonicus]
MQRARTVLMAALLAVSAGAEGPSGNQRHFGGRPFGSGGRPVHGQVGFGQLGQVGGQFGATGGLHGQVGAGQFGAVGGRPSVTGQFGVVGGRPSVSGQFGGFPQGVSPPLIAAPQRPVCKFFKKGPYGNYICDVDQKPFECPLVRPQCPRFGVPIGPQTCYNDNDCYGNDKCCRDACFDYLICKGPE